MSVRPGRLVQRKTGNITGVLVNVERSKSNPDNSECEVAFGFLSVDDAKQSKNYRPSKIRLKYLKFLN